jgi:hypothetical protein
LVLLTAVACTKEKKEPEEVTHLRQRLLEAEKQMVELTTKLKNADIDPGTKNALEDEKQLLTGRIGRMAHNWQIAAPGLPVPQLPAESAGEH